MLVGQYHLVAGALNTFGVQRESGVAGFPEGGFRRMGARRPRVSTTAPCSSSAPAPGRATSPTPRSATVAGNLPAAARA